MSEVKKIVEYKGNVLPFHLSEINQFMDIKFAFLNENYEQIHRECKCRDFLGDIPWSRAFGSSVNIYGMKYDYEANPYDLKVTRFSLKFPRKESMENFIKNFHFITQKEDVAGLPHSVSFETDRMNTLVIESSPFWQSNNWKLSLYSFYLKCMAYPELGNYSGVEANYIENLSPNRELTLLQNIKNPFKDSIEDLHESHNYSGFVSLFTHSRHPARKQMVGSL